MVTVKFNDDQGRIQNFRKLGLNVIYGIAYFNTRPESYTTTLPQAGGTFSNQMRLSFATFNVWYTPPLTVEILRLRASMAPITVSSLSPATSSLLALYCENVVFTMILNDMSSSITFLHLLSVTVCLFNTSRLVTVVDSHMSGKLCFPFPSCSVP